MWQRNQIMEASLKGGSSWYHYVKILQEDGSTKYSKKGGFSTAAEAEKSYAQCEAAFKKASGAYCMSCVKQTGILALKIT